MFHHEDGLPNEDAFVDHMERMKDGETVKIPKGMRRRDALLCVGAAETRTHICFSVKGDTVYAREDPYVTMLFRAPIFSKGNIPEGQKEIFRQAVERVRRKRDCTYRISGYEITVEP